MSLRIFIVLIMFCITTYLFYRASGTLSITKINMVSYIYYLFILTAFIGGSLVFIGYRDHYLIKMVVNKENLDITYALILYCAIVIPLSIILVMRLLKVSPRKKISEKLREEIIIDNEKEAFLLISMAAVICILISIYMFIKMGRLPLLDLIFNRGSDLGHLRREISTTNYMNPYVKNLIVLTLTPLLSYFTYIFWRSTKDKKWLVLFSLLFVFSLFIKTYNYSKSPVVFYLAIFLILQVVIRGNIPRKIIWPAGIGFILIILFMYSRTGYDINKALDIYNGPIGRTVFTSIGTLFLHIELFTGILPSLAGRSLSPTVLALLGVDLTHVRSGRVVMEYFSPYRMHAETAGVMNSLFVGEAFANFGVLGALLSPIYVGILIGLGYSILLKCKKTPENIMMYTVLVVFFSTVLNGGFSDFIYNFNIIFVIVALMMFKLCTKYLNLYIASKRSA